MLAGVLFLSLLILTATHIYQFESPVRSLAPHLPLSRMMGVGRRSLKLLGITNFELNKFPWTYSFQPFLLGVLSPVTRAVKEM